MLISSTAVEKFGFGQHEADLPELIRDSHKADLVRTMTTEAILSRLGLKISSAFLGRPNHIQIHHPLHQRINLLPVPPPLQHWPPPLPHRR